MVSSPTHGTAYMDDSVEQLCQIVQELKDFPIGEIVEAWSNPAEECPEEMDMPDPLAFGEEILHYMEMTNDEAREEYYSLLEEHISPEMRKAVPRVIDIMTSSAALETFAPSAWNGLKIKPIEFDIIPGMPTTMPVKARNIRPDLYAHAKKEFDRLVLYFYESDRTMCTSPIASPLVIAPKATSPYIRFCGDYRRINEFIKIPKHPIPIVPHELTKASQYKVFIDLDMTNSFHQLPLSEPASQLLSVQTPWGLVRPKFLPEGVGPASGLLQSIVGDIFDFEDFKEWTIVIFDNFLVLANDYEDAASKLERVIDRCAAYGVVLKIKKSFIGVDTVTFFGYEVSHGKWKLSEARKDSIDALPFPQSRKEMQSFLGAALFFHNHIADYSQWAAKLYEMTHDSFSWDPTTWTFDYRGHFDHFKTSIRQACTLHFPRYDLPWVIRCDASEHAVGAVLFQILTLEDGTVDHQPIAFSSKRFSEPAQKWDAYKREAYAIYHSVDAFSWYLRGKEFIVETDHRNLQWIETSLSPIVCRWRALLQAFSFKIRHIPGRENKVADWMSRPAILKVMLVTSDQINQIRPNCSDPTSSDTSDQISQIRLIRSDPSNSLRYDPSRSNSTDSIYIRQVPIDDQSPSNSGNYHHIRGTPSIRYVPSNSTGSSAAQPSTPTTPTQPIYCSVCSAVLGAISADKTLPSPLNDERSVDSILHECHGGRTLHYGAARTWQLVKERFPQAKISIRQVMDYVRECPLCQKTRSTGIKGLASRTLSLKPSHYRKTVGVDLTTVTPMDNNGNTCVVLVVEHFSHYPVVYPTKDYTADSVAKVLFKHYCSHGTFDQVATDPGSVFMSEVMAQLNSWLSIFHKVSLVGRHQSNGCEASSAQFLRHLRTLVLDERLYHQWSDDTVLPLINLFLASYPTQDTGGFTPLQLKYGTLDATRFTLPEQLILAPGIRATKLIKDLDDNLQTIRSISRELQLKLAAERAAADKNISQYEPGDLVLFNPREQQSDHLQTKLTPDWLGPYQVIQQG